MSQPEVLREGPTAAIWECTVYAGAEYLEAAATASVRCPSLESLEWRYAACDK